MRSQEEIIVLSQIHSDLCLSIYLPTHRQGQEAWSHNDQILLKTQIHRTQKRLIDKDIAVANIQKFLQPILDLLVDQTFWQHQDTSLAIFRTRDFFDIIKLPTETPVQNYLATDLLVWPLLAISGRHKKAYVLNLNQTGVSLYLADQFQIKEIDIPALTQLSLKVAVGDDVVQKSLQFRSDNIAYQSASFHGHGDGKEDKIIEIQKYLRMVDATVSALMKTCHDKLILAGPQRLIPLYRDITKAGNIHTKPIIGGGKLTERQIFDAVKEIIGEDQTQHDKEMLADFMDLRDTSRIGAGIEQVLPAALQGKIDVLFIAGYPEISGTFNPTVGHLNISTTTDLTSVSLVNKAAVLTVQNGGQVVHISEQDKSIQEDIFAIYRYS